MLLTIFIFPLFATIFCLIIGLLMFISGLGERPKPDAPTTLFGAAFLIFAIAAAITARHGWLVHLHLAYMGTHGGHAVFTLCLFGFIFSIAAFFLRLFSGGKFDTQWFQFTLQTIWNAIWRYVRPW